MNVVMIVPTGLGFEIGGYAGDANAASKLMAECSDILIIHPNVVNASDINEMTPNTWYVEGNMLDRFLWGHINLYKPKSNKILVAVNKPAAKETINAVQAARVTLGADINIIELNEPLIMTGWITDKGATGSVIGYESLIKQVKNYDFDALAITTSINVEHEHIDNYLHNNTANPYGAVEAICSRLISQKLDKPVAHSPFGDIGEYCLLNNYNEITDPRISPEMVSITYLHSVLKGLHKAPRVALGRSRRVLSVYDIDLLISPVNCWGDPHDRCVRWSIPIIFVEQNTNKIDCPKYNENYYPKSIKVSNYIEAAGMIMLIKAGLTIESVTRPISKTQIMPQIIS